MVVNDRIRQRDQQAVAAIGTLDARFFADSGKPLISAGRGIASFASGFAFPTDGIDVGTASEQATKQGNFVFGAEPRGFQLQRGRLLHLWFGHHTPFNAIGLQKSTQARILLL